MALEIGLHECGECGAKFLTDIALRGHKSTHSDPVLEYRGDGA